MKQIYKQLVTGILTLALIAVLIPTSAHALGQTIQPRNLSRGVTGVESASTTALDTNLATNIAGESAFFNRLMTLLFDCTPVSTTTDSTVVGKANLGWFWITGQSASSSIVFYDALQNNGDPKIADWGIPASTTLTSYPHRIVGASFSTGIFADITGTMTLNYCYNNAS